jgi:hypothetical protein
MSKTAKFGEKNPRNFRGEKILKFFQDNIQVLPLQQTGGNSQFYVDNHDLFDTQ